MSTTKQTGDLRKAPDGYAVTFERHFAFDVKTVWDAITNPEKMALWFFKVTMDLRPGGRMVVHFPDGTPSNCRITRVEPGSAFGFEWENEEGPDEVALWELFPESDKGCKLVFNYSRISEGFAINVPTGWHITLDHLEEVLNGRRDPIPDTGPHSPEKLVLKAKYAEIWYRQFPPFRLSSNYGTVRAVNGRYDIIFERLLSHPVARVWEALTMPGKLSQWLGGPSSIDLRPGGKISLGLLMTTVEGIITRLEEEKLLEYTWGPDNTVRWELTDAGNGQCLLVFTETGAAAEDLPGAVPGWHGYLDFLEMTLNGEQVPSFPLEGWQEIAKEVTEKYKTALPMA